MLRLNVYGFNVQRQSQIDAGYQSGDGLVVVAVDPEAAKAVAIAFIADDLAHITSPTLIKANALYDDGTGLPPPAPVNTTVPYVTGAGVVGMPLNCTMGEWDGEPTSYSYLWKRDAVTVASGASADYTVQPTDLGGSITCIVTASNDSGSAAAPPSNAITITAVK